MQKEIAGQLFCIQHSEFNWIYAKIKATLSVI